MNADDLTALAPLLVLAGAAVLVMLAAAFSRSHGLVAALTLAGLAASIAALAIAWPLAPRQVTTLLRIDRYALFYMGLIMSAAFAVAMLSYDYLKQRGKSVTRPEEYYLLLLLATTGAAVLVASIHFASFFLGLELLSVALFALVAYPRTHPLSVEAGVKYLILTGVSSAFLLFGMALVYAAVGTMDFGRVAAAADNADRVLTLAGLSLILVGIGFKLSLAPFHLWAPDVYQGAPAPATAFVATVSKGAVFALLLRYFTQLNTPPVESLVALLTALAIVSMFVGNLLALLQKNIKRLLAYSSIAHMGYLLVALLASGAWAPLAVTYYLGAYFVTTLGAFGIVSALATPVRETDAIEDYQGLAWRRPWLAGVFSAMLLSLAGIPLTAGFIGKFYVLAAGVKSDLWLLVVTLVVNGAIGLFYYLRVMVTLYRHPIGDMRRSEEDLPYSSPKPLAIMTNVALLVLTLALLWLGIYPAPATRVIQAIVAP
jgi:NADH-quinone oxidoreductase subunit N